MQVTHTATLGYQEITITQTIEGDLVYSARLEHTRVAPWPTARIAPELIEGLDSFLNPIEITPFSLSHRFAGALRTDLSRSINSARIAIRDSVYRAISDNWFFSRRGADDSSNRETAARYFSYAYPSIERFIDGVSDRFVQLVLDYFRENESVLACPDDIEECGVVHFHSLEHELADLERFLCPTDYLNGHPYITEDGEESTITCYAYGNGLDSRFNMCYECNRYIHPAQQESENTLRPGTRYPTFLCLSCYDDIYYGRGVVSCERCEEEVDIAHATEREEYDEDYGEFLAIYYCEGCARNLPREDSNRLSLHNYSYKPDPIFHVKKDKDKERPFMGMELEVAREQTQNTRDVNRWINKLPNDLFYVKSDSSVYYGMEVVTHPFTWAWAKEEFPYNLFEELIAIPGVLPKHESAGTHIHIEKAAFDEEHMWKFLLFFCENPDFFGMIGERGTGNHYGSFTTQGMKNLKANVKLLAEHKGNTQSLNISLGRDAINVTPRNTIELRFCAGNVYPHGIKKNQQLVHSVFEFTKKVPVDAAEAGALADAGYFLGFLEDNDYPELKSHIEQMFPKPKKLEGVN